MNHNTISISAVIPTKNRHDDLLKAVMSVLSQTTMPNSLVIVDQSTSNNSQEIIEQLFKNSKTKLIYIYDENIAGLVHAKKVGVNNSDANIVSFLEDDVVLEANYIEKIIEGFVLKEEMMGCCGVITNLPKLPRFYEIFFHIFHRGIFYDKRVGIHGYTNKYPEQLIQSTFLSGGTSAFKREVFEMVPFDILNGFFMLEDIDFSTRANIFYGSNFYINTSAKLAHYMSPQNRELFAHRYHRKTKEFFLFHKKNSLGLLSHLHFIWLLFGLSLEALYKSIQIKKVSPLSGFMSGVLEGANSKVINDYAK
ncbi:MAG: glycosyltransferase family 2 protein [Methylotenera sp.]|nr:glycosyltransferase family 2 protein [Methylotenera sp.]